MDVVFGVTNRTLPLWSHGQVARETNASGGGRGRVPCWKGRRVSQKVYAERFAKIFSGAD